MATKIQVRRDTGAAWDGVKNDPSSALAPGEFGLDTDNNILKLGPGTWSDAQVIATGDLIESDLQAVTDVGNNTDNNITLGTNKITLDATAGGATFANDGLRIQNDGELQLGGTTAAPNMIFKPNGSASIGGTLDVYNQFSVNSQDPNVAVLSGNLDGEQTTYIAASGSATFAESLNAAVSLTVGNPSGNRVDLDQSGAVAANYNGIQSWLLSADGSATFAKKSDASKIGLFNVGASGTQRGYLALYGEAVGSGIVFNVNGTITGTINYDGSTVFNLEYDNDAYYTTTTDSEGNETRVYNGPTLDVKAVIQELQQRVADRDAVIADFATRLAQLEADHATLMANGNSGGY